jgi:hypothetical protein
MKLQDSQTLKDFSRKILMQNLDKIASMQKAIMLLTYCCHSLLVDYWYERKQEQRGYLAFTMFH